MKRVTGLGGILFKTKTPESTASWYQKHLGVPLDGETYGTFHWRDAEKPEKAGMTAWCLFEPDTEYFGASGQTFMVNYRVDDLDALLEALVAEGVTVLPKRDDSEFGRFAWILDPEGHRIELWQPPAE